MISRRERVKPLIIIFKDVNQTQVKNYGGPTIFLFLLPVLDRIQVSVISAESKLAPARTKHVWKATVLRYKPLCHHCHERLAPAAPAGKMGQCIPGGTGRFPISGYLWIKSGHLSGGGDSALASGVEEMS